MKLKFKKLVLLAVLEDEDGKEYAVETDDTSILSKTRGQPKTPRGPNVVQSRVLHYIRCSPGQTVRPDILAYDLHKAFPDRTEKSYRDAVNHLVSTKTLVHNGIRGSDRRVALPTPKAMPLHEVVRPAA